MKPIQICFLFLLTILLVSSSSAVSTPSWHSIYSKSSGIAKGWKYIVIHHSGTDAGSADSFHRYHEKMGYGGLCYHFVIGNGNGTPDGKVETGFRWKEQVIGTHVDVNSWYHNIFGIGICLVGNFNKDRPTKKQMESLKKLVQKLMQEQSRALVAATGQLVRRQCVTKTESEDVLLLTPMFGRHIDGADAQIATDDRSPV